jgi:gamma-glutamyltranspeptidase/glutathione hydrolase
VERRALSPDTMKMLADRGHVVEEQGNWGSATVIKVLPDEPAEGSEAATMPPDASTDLRWTPGTVHGADDNRRPGGAAMGQ